MGPVPNLSGKALIDKIFSKGGDKNVKNLQKKKGFV
jgi:hypothetical protein